MKKLLSYLALLCVALSIPLSAKAELIFYDDDYDGNLGGGTMRAHIYGDSGDLISDSWNSSSTNMVSLGNSGYAYYYTPVTGKVKTVMFHATNQTSGFNLSDGHCYYMNGDHNSATTIKLRGTAGSGWNDYATLSYNSTNGTYETDGFVTFNNVNLTSSGFNVYMDGNDRGWLVFGGQLKSTTSNQTLSTSGTMTTSLNGNYKIIIDFTNAKGSSGSIKVSVEEETPTASIEVSPATGHSVAATSLEVTLTPSNCTNAWYSIDGGTHTTIPVSGKVTLTNNTYAQKSFTLTYGDDSGNLGSATYTLQDIRPSALYIVGSFSGENWAASNRTALTKSNDEWSYYINDVTLAVDSDSSPNGRFRLTRDASNWSKNDYGPSTDKTNITLSEGSATVNFIDTNGQEKSWTLTPGVYNIKLNFETNKMTISLGTNPQITVSPESYTGENSSVSVTLTPNSDCTAPKYSLNGGTTKTALTPNTANNITISRSGSVTEEKTLTTYDGDKELKSYTYQFQVIIPSVTLDKADGTYRGTTLTVGVAQTDCTAVKYTVNSGAEQTLAGDNIVIGDAEALVDQSIVLVVTPYRNGVAGTPVTGNYTLQYPTVVSVTSVEIEHKSDGALTALEKNGTTWKKLNYEYVKSSDSNTDDTRYRIKVTYSDSQTKYFAPENGNANYWVGELNNSTQVETTTGYLCFNNSTFGDNARANVSVTFTNDEYPQPKLTLKKINMLYVYGRNGNFGDVYPMDGLMTSEDGVIYTWSTADNIPVDNAKCYFRVYDRTIDKHYGWMDSNYYINNTDTWTGELHTYATSEDWNNFKAIYLNLAAAATNGVTIYFDNTNKKAKYTVNVAAANYYFCQRQDGKTWYDAENNAHGSDPNDAVDVNNTMVPLIANGDGTYSADVIEVRGSGVLTASQVQKICGTAVTYTAPDRSFIIQNADGTEFYGAVNPSNKVENGVAYTVAQYATDEGHRMNVLQTIVAEPDADTEFGKASTYAKKCTITFDPSNNKLTISGEKPVYTIYGTFNGWDYTAGHELMDIEHPDYVDSGVFGVFIPSLTNGTNDDNPGFKILTQNQQHNTRSWGNKGQNWTPADEIPSTTSSDPTDVYQAYSLIANPTGTHTQGMNNLMIKNDVENVYVLFFPEDDILNSYIVEDATEGKYTLVGTFNSWNSKSVKHSFTKVQDVRNATGYISTRKYKLKLSNLAGSFKLVESGTDMKTTNYQHYLPSDKEYANGQSQTIILSYNNPAASPRRQAVAGDVHLTNAMTLESGTLQNVTLTIEETYSGDASATVTERKFAIAGDPVYSVVVKNGSDVKYYRMSKSTLGEDPAYQASVPTIPANAEVYLEVDEYSVDASGNVIPSTAVVTTYGATSTQDEDLKTVDTTPYYTTKLSEVGAKKFVASNGVLKNAIVYFLTDKTAMTIVIPSTGVSYRLVGNYGNWGVEYAYTFTPDPSKDNTYVLTIPELQMTGNDPTMGFQVARVTTNAEGKEVPTYYGYGSGYADGKSGLDDDSLSKGQKINFGDEVTVKQNPITLDGKTNDAPSWLDSVVLTLTVGNTMSSAKGRAAAAVGTGAPLSLTVKSTVATAIDEVEADLYPADVYTLTGVCVLRDAKMDDLRNLAPGLYIYKGQKLIIK